jgi:hypothetical protein
MVALLAVGAVGGVRWSDRHAAQTRAAERRATLAVTALSESYVQNRSDSSPVLDVVVRVFNNGPEAVEVVRSDPAATPGAGSTLVRGLGLGDDLSVRPGGQLAVAVSQGLDCDQRDEVRLRVPVRTADGTVHAVTVGRTGPDRLVPRELCAADQAFAGDVTASLGGTLTRPAVVLSNPHDRMATVYLDPGSPLTQVSSEVVSLRTTPRLPVDVPAHGTLRVGLAIEVGTCVRSLTALQASGGFGHMALVAQVGSPQSATGVRTSLDLDLMALIGAAAQRSCG